PQSFIQSMGFAGNAAIGAGELLALVYDATAERDLSAPVEPGAPLSASGIEDGRIELIRHYRDQGYLYVRAFSHVSLSTDGLWADVTYTVEEGPQVRVQRVLVRGNRYTREGIIRSRLTFRAGDLYRLEHAVSDQRSIATLGIFNSVRVKLVDEEHAAERKDLVADVVERNRQPIEVVPGISTANGPRLRMTYSHINVLGTATAFTASLKLNRQIFFDLFGQYAAGLRSQYRSWEGLQQLTHALEREVRLGLRSPPIKALPFDPLFRLDLVDQRLNTVRYSLDSTTAILGVDAFTPWRIKVSVETQLGLTNLECTAAGKACDTSLEVRRLQGRPIDVGPRYTYKYGPQLVMDRRNNPLSPSRGYFASAKFTRAWGAAKPDPNAGFAPFSFNKLEGNLTGYAPLPLGIVLAVSGRAGTIMAHESSVPVDERFYLGGRDTLRGYVESTLIPQDACVVSGTTLPAGCQEVLRPSQLGSGIGPPLSLGGNTYMLLKTELRLPVRESISIDLFVDLGNLWVDFTRVTRLALRVGT
ncbi:MAG TPA: BamA/TamA family outer membrane protein, partial [Myxococcota bacterium]|nr:BamA/TamA family outer membrane protein [Myxococcota bacterium]